MNWRFFVKLILALVLIVAVGGAVVYSFNAGVSRGLALNPQLPAGEAPQYQVPYFGHMYGAPFFWHGGFGFMGLLFPIFIFFVILFAIRGLFGCRPRHWRYMHPGMGSAEWDKFGPGHDFRSMAEEWHRKQHEEKPAESETKS